MTKTVVVGVDGASWNLLEPWMEAGELPNLQRLVDGGVRGDLESCLPPVTFPAWKCLSTGRYPGKLGVYWWMGTDWEKREVRVHRSADFDGPEVWDVLGGAGVRVGVVNMPTTFPPKKVNGVMVSGPPAVDGRPYAYPARFQRRLERRYGYRVNAEEGGHESPQAHVRHILNLIEMRFDVAQELLPEVDFLHLTIFYVDKLQHWHWDGPETRRAWATIDRRLGELLDAGHNVVLVSDHGFTPLKAHLYMNTWLAENGFLRMQQTLGDRLYKVGIHKGRLHALARWTGLRHVLPGSVKKAAKDRLLDRDGLAGWETRARKVDWARSDALAGGAGLLYVRPGDGHEERVERIRRAILADGELSELVADVHHAEDVWPDAHGRFTPDLYVEPVEGVEVQGALGYGKVVKPVEEGRWKATHRRAGVFAATGPAFRRGARADARIVDVAPTLLALHGLPGPPGADGAVIREALQSGALPEAPARAAGEAAGGGA